MQKLLREQGMSLIEITVAGAAAIGLALGGAQLFKSQNTSQKTVEANYEVAGHMNQMRNILNDPDNCLLSLQGNKPAMNPATEAGNITRLIKRVPVTTSNPTGQSEVYVVNQLLPGNIKVTQYLMNKSDPSLASDETMLVVTFSRGKSAIKEFVDKKIKIAYALNGTGEILSCSATLAADSEIWQRSGDDPNDIYYNDGRVGVGLIPRTSGLTEAFSVARGSHFAAAGFHDGGVNVFSHDDAAQPVMGLIRERGSYSAPTDTVAGDSLGTFSFMGKVGGTNPAGAVIQGLQTGPGNGSALPGALIMMTNNGGTAPIERMRISSAGNVGIGTATPTGLLSVGDGNGTFQVNADGDINVTGGVDSRWGLYSSSVERMAVESSGAVKISGSLGIGTGSPDAKLHVDGSVKLAGDTRSCSATLEGVMRYNSSTRAMQYCDGTSWLDFGGGMNYSPSFAPLNWQFVSGSASGGGSLLGGHSCGLMLTLSVSAPGMTAATKAAIINFYSVDSSDNSPAAIIYDNSGNIVGVVGQAGRGGDGKSYGAGGEMVVPLSGLNFKMRLCKRDGDSTSFRYAVKAFHN